MLRLLATKTLWELLYAPLIAVSLAAASVACDCRDCCCRERKAVSVRDAGTWRIADSPNFQVCSLISVKEAERVARHCECLRTKLAATWNPQASPWKPRCQIVLHAGIDGYRRAVGAGADATSGSSLVTPLQGVVTARRIDLRADVDDVLTAALPHELFHVVIADRFRSSLPPLWFDEGMAIQYDVASKRTLHDRDVQAALAAGTAFTIDELIAVDAYPPADRWGAFYGQSGAFVRWLLTNGSPEEVLAFARESRSQGIHFALARYHPGRETPDIDLAWRREGPSLTTALPPAWALPTADGALLADGE